MTYHALTAGWTARILTETAPADLDQELRAGIPATVPGVVHTDLLTAGLITDPFVDDAESTLQWIGRSDWEYRTTFDWSDDGSVRHEIGRASCRARVCQYVSISVGAGSLKKKQNKRRNN